MERMTDGVRRSTYILIPNAHSPTREILAFSGRINDDDDYYFNDPLFPRIDEDTAFDMDEDGDDGIIGIDDGGDGYIDEGVADSDDDEGSYADEDPHDGVDNDGDGNVDEDISADSNADGAPGINRMDDDGDGPIDEGEVWDDDEDGTIADIYKVGLMSSITLNRRTSMQAHYLAKSAANHALWQWKFVEFITKIS
jgi:hypothetical protein